MAYASAQHDLLSMVGFNLPYLMLLIIPHKYRQTVNNPLLICNIYYRIISIYYRLKFITL